MLSQHYPRKKNRLRNSILLARSSISPSRYWIKHGWRDLSQHNATFSQHCLQSSKRWPVASLTHCHGHDLSTFFSTRWISCFVFISLWIRGGAWHAVMKMESSWASPFVAKEIQLFTLRLLARDYVWRAISILGTSCLISPPSLPLTFSSVCTFLTTQHNILLANAIQLNPSFPFSSLFVTTHFLFSSSMSNSEIVRAREHRIGSFGNQ